MRHVSHRFTTQKRGERVSQERPVRVRAPFAMRRLTWLVHPLDVCVQLRIRTHPIHVDTAVDESSAQTAHSRRIQRTGRGAFWKQRFGLLGGRGIKRDVSTLGEIRIADLKMDLSNSAQPQAFWERMQGGEREEGRIYRKRVWWRAQPTPGVASAEDQPSSRGFGFVRRNDAGPCSHVAFARCRERDRTTLSGTRVRARAAEIDSEAEERQTSR